MMSVMDVWNQVIGKKVLNDVFSASGILLVPAATTITAEHVALLEKHGIFLTEADVTDAEPSAPARSSQPQPQIVIDEAVRQAGSLFEGIRGSNKVPVDELRSEVIPMVHEVALNSGLFDLFSELQAKDDYTYRHNIAVGMLSTMIGRWMGLPEHDLLELTTAGLLHDVGKMQIPEEILSKPGKLTDEEFELMKQHTVYGYELLRNTPGISERQALVALRHHERLDGSGYPAGLKGDQIDLFSRIVAVADIFHAMTSPRVYREASEFHEVLYQLNNDAYSALDPTITGVFIHKIMQSLIGQRVLLTNEQQGTVVMVHQYDPLHPLVQIGDEYVDLSKMRTVKIKKVL